MSMFSKRFRTAILVSAIAICYSVGATAHAQLVYYNDFNQHSSTRKYKEADLDAEWNQPAWNNGVGQGRVKVENSWQAFGGTGTCLSVKHPGNRYGASATGAQWKMEFDQAYEEVYLTYRVKFKKHFDFVKGGKLPGLAGGSAPTGNAPADGFNGWTARMMWRTFHTGNPGDPKQKTSHATSYAKYVGSGWAQDGRDEDDRFFVGEDGLSTLKSNRWYEITQRVRMNTPWEDDGVLQIWLDGELVVDQQDVRFRNTYDLGIDCLYFSNFFGGGWSWRTSRYSTTYFDDFTIIAVE